MRQTTKNILGVTAIVLLSSGVGGYTAYKLLSKERLSAPSTAFNELFQQNPSSNIKLAGFNSVNAQPVDLTQAAESSVHAVVHIRATQLGKTETIQTMPDFFDFFFGDGRGQQRQIQTQPRVGFGSGVIISKDGYIVTNNHVVEGADEIVVKLNDERELKGRIIGTDGSTDLALLKIEGNDFPTIPIGNSDDLKVGEWVLAVGNPFNLNSTVTAGIVSAKARSIGSMSANGKAADIQSFIQTDAAINSGNSGGALVNARGELVGINAMLYSPTGAYSGYGFAIPTSIMTKVVADLKQYGTVQRALLGVSCTDLNVGLVVDEEDKRVKEIKDKAKELGLKEGLWIREIVEGGSSDGLLKVDDVLVAIEGKEIHRFADLQEELAKHRPGDKVTVTVIRDKKKKDIAIVLKNQQGNTKVIKDADMELLGAAFRPITKELKEQLNLNYGLEVTGVRDGKMKEAGIRRGFIILKVNDMPMRSVEDMETALKAASRSNEPVLFITGKFPSGRVGYYAVNVGQEE